MMKIDSVCLAAMLTTVMMSQSTVESFGPSHAFVANKQQQQLGPNCNTVHQGTSVDSDLHNAAQQHLEKAKMLRRQAEQASLDLQLQRAQKKIQQDHSTDELIESYFFGIDEYSASCSPDDALLNRLRDRRLSVKTLLRIVDRIFERESIAASSSSSSSSSSNNNSNMNYGCNNVQLFRRANTNINYDDDENMLDGCIEALIEICKILDDDFNNCHSHAPAPSNAYACVAHAFEEYHGNSNVSCRLQNRFHQLQSQALGNASVCLSTTETWRHHGASTPHKRNVSSAAPTRAAPY